MKKIYTFFNCGFFKASLAAILFLIFMVIQPIKAQQNLTLYNFKSIPQSNYINPGIIPSSRVNIGLPIISSLYLNKSNSGFKLNDVVTKGSNGATKLDFENLVSKLADDNYYALALHTDLLTAGFKYKENYISFNASYKLNWRVRYPKDLLNFVWKGNGASLGEPLQFNLGLDASTYLEYGVGFAREVSDTIAVLNHGNIEEIGTPEKIFSQPESPMTREFLKKYL